MEQERFVQTLIIAGSNSGDGAGIQADLKTFQVRGVFGTNAVTTVTTQNTPGVAVVHLMPAEVICDQAGVVRDDFQISVFKLGMLGMAEIIGYVAECLKECSSDPMVFDPVMIAKGGASLLHDSAVAAMKQHLLSLTGVLTPSLPETQVLAGIDVENVQDTERAARVLQDVGVKIVVVKGGHLGDNHSAQCMDWVFLPGGEKLELSGRRYLTPHTHGMGYTFSTCVTVGLARGFSVENAMKAVKVYITAAIANPPNIDSGHGPVNHWAYRD